MIIAIAICTNKKLMQVIPNLTPELLALPDIAERVADYALAGLSKRCDPDEKFANAMVTAADPANQPVADEIRGWIYKHLKVEVTEQTKLDGVGL